VPPLEERVAALERELVAMGKRLDAADERHVREHRELTDRFSGWIAEARREIFDLEQKLRPVIGAAAAGNIRRRVLGVGLFATGLLMQTIANVLAL
jgi:hypothetical protein